MPKVFIINNSGHDFTEAKKFGELVSMTRGRIPDRYNVTEMLRSFAPFFADSSEDDFILHTGPGVMSAIACAAFAAKHKRVNLLIHRAEQNGNDRYVHRKIVFNGDSFEKST